MSIAKRTSEVSSVEQASERSERTSKRTSEWPSTSDFTLGCFGPLCTLAAADASITLTVVVAVITTIVVIVVMPRGS